MMVKESKDAAEAPKRRTRNKRVLSQAERDKCLDNLRKGRETIKRNKEAKKKQKEETKPSQDNIKKVIIKEPEKKKPPTPPPVVKPASPPPQPVQTEEVTHVPKSIQDFKGPFEDAPAPRKYYGFTF